MSRLFITPREMNFIADITKEVVKDVVGQRVFYYPISELKTRAHEFYNESPEKVYDNPIEIHALVDSPENSVRSNIFGPEKQNKLSVFLQFQDLIDRGINVSIGDFLRYGEHTFEITKVTTMRNIYGQVDHVDGIKLECVQARMGQFNPTPVLGPVGGEFSDKNAVEKEFVQQRGQGKVDDKQTGDVRVLQQNGVLDPPLSGPRRVNNDDDSPADSGFYDE